MAKVMFAHVGVEVETEPGFSLLEVGTRHRVDIPTVCNGVATCHECVVRIVSGEANLSPINTAERAHLGNVFHITRERLACQARVLGDVVIDVPTRERRASKRLR